MNQMVLWYGWRWTMRMNHWIFVMSYLKLALLLGTFSPSHSPPPSLPHLSLSLAISWQVYSCFRLSDAEY